MYGGFCVGFVWWGCPCWCGKVNTAWGSGEVCRINKFSQIQINNLWLVDACQLQCVKSNQGQWFGIKTNHVLTVKCMHSVQWQVILAGIGWQIEVVVDSCQQQCVNLSQGQSRARHHGKEWIALSSPTEKMPRIWIEKFWLHESHSFGMFLIT